MTQSTPAAEVALTCAACGYDLRGLDLAGRCPECGHDIAESVRQRERMLADPYGFAAGGNRWRVWFRGGLRVAIAAALASQAQFLFLVYAAISDDIAAWLVMIGLALLAHVGLWTALRSRPLPAARWRWVRRLVVFGVWLTLSSGVVAVVCILYGMAGIAEQFGTVYVAAVGTTHGLMWLYFSRMARVASPRAARWMCAIAGVTFVGHWVIVILGESVLEQLLISQPALLVFYIHAIFTGKTWGDTYPEVWVMAGFSLSSLASLGGLLMLFRLHYLAGKRSLK